MQAHDIEFLQLLGGHVQYVVPRCQRRYRWRGEEIKRLVDDLLAVADAAPESAHYGGTLLTFPEPGAAGVVKSIRVVDGQQRLTTVSILLACVAEALGDAGQCGEWTGEVIRSHLLTNLGRSEDKRRKLRLQHGDEEEYRRGLEGEVDGAGAVSQAWRIARRLVAKTDVAVLLRGLERLRVVSIGLGRHDDPQQIFQSLNATGRPLMESEKVKNWLLMGLPDVEQQSLHDEHWLGIERALGAQRASEPIDLYLRDLLRWWTGKVQGIDHAYEGFRRWAVKKGLVDDRRALCARLAELARLYGILTGSAGAHPDRVVERELRHLRAMGIDSHRPFTLRLLDDCEGSGEAHSQMTRAALAKALGAVATWTTRMWLADRATAGMNRAFAHLAAERGPSAGEDAAEHWIERIRSLRNTSVGVPDDGAVNGGIRQRRAYGGSATQAAFAVLCALMEDEHREESPARDRLTIEHIMPQRLTPEWRDALGSEPGELHGVYRNRLANLTLSGDRTNSALGAKTFDAKRAIYFTSPIGLTRRVASESTWDQGAMDRRSAELARLATQRWPWDAGKASDTPAQVQSMPLRWRVGGGAWQGERVASRMVLNVASALLDLDLVHAQKLSGTEKGSNVHLASLYPADRKAGSRLMRAIPGHEDYVFSPYFRNFARSAEKCREMGHRCGVNVQVEVAKPASLSFWEVLSAFDGGVPGQNSSWRGPLQGTCALNDWGDRIMLNVGDGERVWLYVRAGEIQPSEERRARMRNLSLSIQDQMSDQTLGDDVEKRSDSGFTIAVEREWVRDDEEAWPEVAQWVKDQQVRLEAIVAGTAGPFRV